MSTITLNKLAEISSGQGAPQGEKCFGHKGLPFVRAGSLDFLLSGGKEDDLERVSEEVANEYQLKPYLEGTILFAKSGMSATKDRVYTLKSTCYVVNHLAAIIPKKPVDTDFLKFWFRHFRPSQLIKDKAYPSIRLSDIEEIKVPDFSDEKKRHIIPILKKAESAKQKRREVIRLTNEFLKSAFIEMFGDSVINKNGWMKKKLSESDIEIIDGDRGKNYPKQQDFLDNGWCLFLNTKNVTKEGFKFNTTMFISKEKDQQLRKGKLQRNDIVLTTRGTVGNVALYDNSIPFDNVRINSGMVILRANLEEFNLVFLEALLNSKYFHDQKDRIVSGCAQPQLPIRHLKDIEIFIPPINQQQKFADLVQKVEALKSKQQESKQELDNLFNSLMQKSFKGEIS